MWKFTFCPNFSIVSFPFVMWSIVTVIYIIELIVAGADGDGLSKYIFLGPNWKVLR